MGKVVFWVVVVFVALFALRLYNTAKARRQRDEAAARRKGALQEPMVRCVRCGVYVPRAEAKSGPDGPTCGDPACVRPRS